MSPASTRRASAPRNLPRRKPAGSGFTLVELLVVLVIIALFSGVLLTGFDRVLDIRQRLATFLDGVEAPVLVADWFRSTVSGLVPDADTGRDRFVGEPRRFTGLTLAPLNQTAGVPIRIAWEVVFDPDSGRSYLRYRNGAEAPLTIASWPGDTGGLVYCGADYACRDTWSTDPKAPRQAGHPPQLPSLIRLAAVKGTEAWTILAAPVASPAALPTR